MRRFVLCLSLLLPALPAAADPINYDRVVAFGDSLQDNGNLFRNTGQPSAPYYMGRFSSGPTWIELLSAIPLSANPSLSSNPNSSMNNFWSGGPLFVGPYTVTGNVNAAIGGAGTIPGQSLTPVPAVSQQIGAYLLSGGTFGPNDLISVQGGANDFFKFFTLNPSPTITQIQTQAVTTAINEASNIALLTGAGAKTILVSNLPNIGATPDFNGSALTAQAGLFATVTYNAQLNASTQALAAANPKTNFIQMDWYSALNVILSKPSAFGLTDVTDPCFNGTTVCANPNSYLFWDGVHPTEAGQRLLARYAALLLSTEETGKAVSALAQVALSNRLEASDIIFRRTVTPQEHGPGGLYAEVIGSTASFSGTNTLTYGGTGYDYSLGGVRGGFDASEGRVSFGTSLAYETGDLSGTALKSNIGSVQLDAYALTRFGSLFVGAEGGVSWDNFSKIQRNTGFTAVDAGAATIGKEYSLAGTVGTHYQLGAITLTPAVRLGYAALNINGFVENAPILALQYSDQDVTTGFWTARVRASSPLPFNPLAFAYGEAGYEGLFATSQNYTAQLFNNTAHAVTLSDNLDARGFFFKAGVGGYVMGDIKLSGEYEVSTEDGAGTIQSGRLRVTIPLHGPLALSN